MIQHLRDRACLPYVWSWTVAMLVSAASGLPAVDAAPTIAKPATATPATVVAKSTTLTVLGADDKAAAALRYKWSATGPAPVIFSVNGSSAAKTAMAAFKAAGSYVCTVMVADAANNTTTSSVNVEVAQTVTALTIVPATVALEVGATTEFAVTAKDQFGAEVIDPECVWTAKGDATVEAGFCTVGEKTGSASVIVASGTKTATAAIKINAAAPGSVPVVKATPISALLPADRLANWRIGVAVGVPGGITTKRTRLIDVTKAPYNADRTGASDAHPAIMQAVAVAGNNDVVFLPAGTYRLDQCINLLYRSRITIRGEGQEKTILMLQQGNNAGIQIGSCGSGADWWYPDRQKFAVTGSPVKGDTVLTIGDTKALDAYPNGGLGMLCQVSLKNDRSIPVVVPANFEYIRNQTLRIVKRSGTTVTVSPPLLFPLPDSLEPVLRPGGRSSEFVGVEDLTIDGANATAQLGIRMGESYGCWLKNVGVKNIANYHIGIGDCLQCEIRQCYVYKRKGSGSNGAGFLVGGASNCLFEDNVLVDAGPHVEVNGSCGNVFGYNFCNDSAAFQGDFGILGCSMLTNHGAHCSYNLYEGNVSPKFQSDGYHGSASHDTAFRNWFHGTSPKTPLFWIAVNLNRFTRNYSLVGNILGSKGHSWTYDNGGSGYGYDQHFIYSFGMPNMGNGGASGTAQPSKGKYWADWEKMISGPRGAGPGPGGFQELDLDVKETTILKGNFNYRDNGVAKSESLDGAILPNSLYLIKKPAWFGDLNWPAFGPDTDIEKNKIPAQIRYEEMTRPPDPAGTKP